MLPTALIAAPDFSQYMSAYAAMARIEKVSGRVIYPPQFYAAISRGHISPTLIAGKRIYHAQDVDAFAEKWGKAK